MCSLIPVPLSVKTVLEVTEIQAKLFTKGNILVPGFQERLAIQGGKKSRMEPNFRNNNNDNK